MPKSLGINVQMATTKDTNPKDALGSKKPGLSAIPCQPLFELGLAMTDGACKYRRHNYRIAGVRASIYYDAAMRHLMKFWDLGEDIDPESGLPHLAHAMACLTILRDAQLNGMLNDDRPPPVSPEKWAQLQQMMDALLKRHPSPQPPYTKENWDGPKREPEPPQEGKF